MRHRRKGRILGRSPSHQRALLRNLASALMLTERDADSDEVGAPAVKGRMTTNVAKAKEVRPLVERCVTLFQDGPSDRVVIKVYARRSLLCQTVVPGGFSPMYVSSMTLKTFESLKVDTQVFRKTI